MKRRFVVLLITGVLLVAPTVPALALNRDPNATRQPIQQLVAKTFKQLKKVFRVAPANDIPTIPKPCVPGEPGCP